MSTMLTPPRPSASATSATTPGRLGTETRSSCTAPPARSASSSRAAVLARAVVPGRDAVAVAARRAPRARRARRAIASSIALDQRVGVGEVDVAPDRGVGAGHARDVAEARAGRGQPLASSRAAPRRLGDEHVGEHVRQVRDGREQAVVRRRRRSRRAARRARRAAGAGARRACPRVARGRRQVPGRAVEQLGARVAHAVSAPARAIRRTASLFAVPGGPMTRRCSPATAARTTSSTSASRSTRPFEAVRNRVAEPSSGVDRHQ